MLESAIVTSHLPLANIDHNFEDRHNRDFLFVFGYHKIAKYEGSVYFLSIVNHQNRAQLTVSYDKAIRSCFLSVS